MTKPVRRSRATAAVVVAVLASCLGCDRGPAGAPPPQGRGDGAGGAPAPPETAPPDDVPPMPEGFSLYLGGAGADEGLSLSEEDGAVWRLPKGGEQVQIGVLRPAQRAALWRLLHERGLTRLRSPARGLPGETILQVLPGTIQVAYVRGQEPPGFVELVEAVKAALHAARPPAPSAPGSLVVFVGDPPADEAPRGAGGPVVRHIFEASGTWLEADGTVAREDRQGLRLVGLLPEQGRAEVWELLHQGGFDGLELGDPSGPVLLAVWVDGRERRVTREPGTTSAELLELQRLVRERLGAGLAPVPPPTVPPRPTDFSFTLGHGGGAAAQWDELVVGSDGAVERRSRRSGGAPAGRVGPEVLDAVWFDLHALRFFELGSVPGNMTDAITVNAAGREHHVAYAMGQGPVRFRILLASLRSRVP